MNAPSLVHGILQSPSGSLKLLPATATFWLALASYLAPLSNVSLWVSILAENVANLPVLPTSHPGMGCNNSTCESSKPSFLSPKSQPCNNKAHNTARTTVIDTPSM
ncbi:hypothetical protein CVT25_013273 [Psilocybe cyanescens]|uniref:Uncharacterized protein n=1 Tax=Psilocybe cyanescens TaxID=93625 RepID=A0A409XHS4_PSICY|nr:hypothetical protein CVT25_013273 [Psilocybe cyanescens]